MRDTFSIPVQLESIYCSLYNVDCCAMCTTFSYMIKVFEEFPLPVLALAPGGSTADEPTNVGLKTVCLLKTLSILVPPRVLCTSGLVATNYGLAVTVLIEA
jgi:hypothetical protein